MPAERWLLLAGVAAGVGLLWWVSVIMSFVLAHGRAPLGGGELLNWLLGL